MRKWYYARWNQRVKWNRLFKMYQDTSTLLRLFEVLQDQKSQQIEKSRSRNGIKLTNSWSRLRQTVEVCQKCHVMISQSWSRLLGLEGGVETKSRFLNLDRDILIIETNFLKVSRFSRLSRSALCQCRDRESRSRHNRDKLRTPGLEKLHSPT